MRVVGLLILAAGLHAGQAAPAMPGVNVPAVKVDTAGYAPAWAKKAILNFKPKQVVVFGADEKPKLILPPSAITEFGKDAASGDPVWTADFSALTMTGRYKVQLQFEADRKSVV